MHLHSRLGIFLFNYFGLYLFMMLLCCLIFLVFYYVDGSCVYSVLSSLVGRADQCSRSTSRQLVDTCCSAASSASLLALLCSSPPTVCSQTPARRHYLVLKHALA